MEAIPRKFWLVWNPEGQNPQYRHVNVESAIEEAKRLAGQTGGDFYVLESMAIARRTLPPVECVVLLPPIDLDIDKSEQPFKKKSEETK